MLCAAASALAIVRRRQHQGSRSYSAQLAAPAPCLASERLPERLGFTCRYRKRGVNDAGRVANEVEIEQVVDAGFDWRTGFPLLASLVQVGLHQQ